MAIPDGVKPGRTSMARTSAIWLLHLRDPPEAGVRRRTDNRSAAAFLRQPWRRTVQCGDAVLSFPLPQVQHAELGLAQPRRVRQYGLEHGLQVAGRARDDTQHFIGRRLPLQCLGKVLPSLDKFVPVFFELLFQIGTRLTYPINARSRLRSGRTKLAAALAARPGYRQA